MLLPPKTTGEPSREEFLKVLTPTSPPPKRSREVVATIPLRKPSRPLKKKKTAASMAATPSTPSSTATISATATTSGEGRLSAGLREEVLSHLGMSAEELASATPSRGFGSFPPGTTLTGEIPPSERHLGWSEVTDLTLSPFTTMGVMTTPPAAPPAPTSSAATTVRATTASASAPEGPQVTTLAPSLPPAVMTITSPIVASVPLTTAVTTVATATSAPATIATTTPATSLAAASKQRPYTSKTQLFQIRHSSGEVLARISPAGVGDLGSSVAAAPPATSGPPSLTLPLPPPPVLRASDLLHLERMSTQAEGRHYQLFRQSDRVLDDESSRRSRGEPSRPPPEPTPVSRGASSSSRRDDERPRSPRRTGQGTRFGQGLYPGSMPANYAELSSGEFRDRVVYSLRDLELRFDQLAISDQHRRVAALEARVARVEGFDARLQVWEDRAAATYELQRWRAEVEQTLGIIHKDIADLQVIAGSPQTMFRLETMFKKSEDAMAAAIEYSRRGHDIAHGHRRLAEERLGTQTQPHPQPQPQPQPYPPPHPPRH